MKKLIILTLILFISACGSNETKQDQENPLKDIDPKTVVEFKDEEFEKMIREMTLKPDGDIYAEDMEAFDEINLNAVQVSDLTGLEYAKNLTIFSANKTNLNSLKPLKNLEKLERLTIRYLELEDPILEFSNNVNLNYVLIIETNISNLDFLTNMTNLDYLTVNRSGVTNIESLEKLNNLTHINFHGNDITDIEPLRGKTKVTSINFQSNENLANIDALEELTSLEYVTLSYTSVRNLKPLEELEKLEDLTIYLNHDVKHMIFDQISLFENKGVEVSYHR